jgi:hypothetical protein
MEPHIETYGNKDSEERVLGGQWDAKIKRNGKEY